MADVKSKTGAAIASDFGSSSGTPIVVNQTTGDLAVLKTDQSVFIVGSDKAGISQVHYVGTTSIAANRASAAQDLTGITSIDGSAATVTTTVASGAVGTTQTALDNSTKIATTAYADNAGRPILATAQNTTSGTSINFTGIPSWVKRVTVMFNGVSTNGTSNIQVQLGNGSVVTTGYLGGGSFTQNSTTTVGANSTTGLLIVPAVIAATAAYANATISKITADTWVFSCCGGNSNSSSSFSSGGVIVLGSALDRIRLTTVNGTDTFDAGLINLLWE